MRLITLPTPRFLGLLMVAPLVFAAAQSRGEEPVPAAFPKGRYDSLRGRSPFALATATAPPAPATASFAANWFVSGIARLGDNDFVTIKSRDLGTQFSLFGPGDSVDGVVLASVTWSEIVGKSTVVLRKGSETAKLEFNEADIKAAPAQPRAGGPSPVPNGANPSPSVPPRPGMNMPAVPQTGLPPQPVVPPQSSPLRRRPQVIQPPTAPAR